MARHEYGIELTSWDALPKADALVVAVAHKDYMAMSAEAFAQKIVSAGTVVDVKCRLDAAKLEALGLNVWRL